MWNCSVRPDNVDEELLNIMKSAGLERIFYNTLFLSKKLLSLYSVNNYQQIAKAAEITRRIGLYMTVSLKVGTLEETKNDFAETVRALKKILPGECLISQAAYYPGTILFDKMKESNLMNDSIWFTKTNPVISIRDDKSVKEWISNLKNSASVICESAWYKPKDFDKHRKNNLHDCWVTDILEGDYYLDDEQFSYADRSYRRVITDMQKNPWGYLRLGKLKFREGDFETAEEYYKTVTEIVPAYYGGWLKIAEAQLAQSKRKEAKASIEKASSLSMFDARISNIKKVLKVKKI